jgi:RNA polymerase sigma-70 factor (ECF subfamily)
MLSPDNNATDQHLMQAARQGDTQAFDKLVNRLADRIYGLAFRMLGNEQDARDTAQDTFVRMWQSRRRWSPRGAVSTWAYRIATNLSLNRLRSRKRWRIHSVSYSDDTTTRFDIPVPDEESPHALAETADTKHRLETAISQLPPRERAVILLRHHQELSAKDIAKVMDTTVNGVDSLLLRARKRLRMILSDNK